jgi:hypothetical protein
MKIYLVETPNKTLPEGENLVQIKGKASGEQAICVGESSCQACYEMTLSEAQECLDAWVNEENLDPVLDESGNPILQGRVNISAILNYLERISG